MITTINEFRKFYENKSNKVHKINENQDMKELIDDISTIQMKNIILTVANCGYGYDGFTKTGNTIQVKFSGGSFEEIEESINTKGSNYNIIENEDEVIITFDLTKIATEYTEIDQDLLDFWENNKDE